jgi:hypothetical protein
LRCIIRQPEPPGPAQKPNGSICFLR